MADPRNEENEYGENDAMKIADMDTQPELGDGESDMEDSDTDEATDDDAVPGERQSTHLPGDTMAERD